MSLLSLFKPAAKSGAPTKREYLAAQKRLIGKRVQADLPSSLGGYRKGRILKLTPEREVLIECDGSYGTIWCSLDVVTALEEY